MPVQEQNLGASVTEDDRRGVYLFCFARPSAADHISLSGMDGRDAVQSMEANGLAAVHCHVPLEEFTGPVAEANFQELNWVAPRACWHERVVESVMAVSPVLPVRFGTVFCSRNALKEVLIDLGNVVERFLERIDGKQEWSVKVFQDVAKTGEWLAATDPVLVERRRRLPPTPGARYFQEKQLHADIQKQVKLWGRDVAGQVGETLRSLAVEVQSLKLRGRDDAGREMIGHLAFLLNSAGVAEFRGRIEQIGAVYAEQGLTLECSGPWPPYNFCPSLDEFSR